MYLYAGISNSNNARTLHLQRMRLLFTARHDCFCSTRKVRDCIIPAFTQTSAHRVLVQGYRRVELSARDRQKYKAVRTVRGIQLLRDRYRYSHRFRRLTTRDRTIRPEN